MPLKSSVIVYIVDALNWRNNFISHLMLETTVCTFDVNVPYDEWVKNHDIEEAPAR